jgi:hypothetical protein
MFVSVNYTVLYFGKEVNPEESAERIKNVAVYCQ